MGEWSRPRRGLRDGNDRTAVVARWLGRGPPPGAAELHLEVRDPHTEDWPTLARWKASEVDEPLATEINQLVQDTADDNGADVMCRLRWYDSATGGLTEKSMRGRPAAEHAQHVRQLDGSMVSMLASNQKHTEALMMRMVQMVGESESRWERMLDRQEAREERLHDKLLALMEERDAVRDERDAAIEAANDAAETAEAANRRAEEAEQSDKFGQVVEIGMKQIAAASSPAKTKTSKKSE